MLTGPDLIAALKAAPEGATEDDRIRLAGYVYSGQVKKSLNRGGFYKALAAASPELSALAGRTTSTGQTGQTGHRLRFSTTVQAKGHAVIGAAYLRHLNAQPHQQLRIIPSENAIMLQLISV
jgi:hypothetical protein